MNTANTANTAGATGAAGTDAGVTGADAGAAATAGAPGAGAAAGDTGAADTGAGGTAAPARRRRRRDHPVARVIRTVVGIIALILSALLMWLGLSPFIASFPYLGIGSLITPQNVGPLLIVGAVVLVVSVGLVVLGSRRLSLLAAAFSVIAVGAFGGILDQQLDSARKAGADVDTSAAFIPGGLKEGASPDETVQYASDDDGLLDMDIYRPSTGGGSAPVLMYVHGGGWDTMDRTSQARNLRWLADQGFLVVSPDYTLATDDRATWDTAGDQVACAMAWVTANARDRGGDPENFFTYGESAGGALVMTASYDAAAGKLHPRCGGAPAVPRAVYADSPAVDPRVIAESNDPVTGDGARRTVEKYLGGSPDEHPDRADAVTVANHVTDFSQPTYLSYGGDDRLVPTRSYDAYRRRMELANRRVIEIVRPHADHASALTYHGVWNQTLLQTMRTFFAGEGAFGFPGGRPPVGGSVPVPDPARDTRGPVGGVQPENPKTLPGPLGGTPPENPKTLPGPLGGTPPENPRTVPGPLGGNVPASTVTS
ncbi:alpha/beta hydrolase [Corynebacterium bovis]|uniref:alpha/beta hydrolase n=1 Tax=Corynebacterium bovis TaxID=36808 RepID=UPI0030804AA1